MTLRITVTDLETGDHDEVEIPRGEYLLICHEPCRLAGAERLENGTHRVVITGHQPGGIDEAQP